MTEEKMIPLSCPFCSYKSEKKILMRDHLEFNPSHRMSGLLSTWIAERLAEQSIEQKINDRIKELESLPTEKDYNDEYFHRIDELRKLLK